MGESVRSISFAVHSNLFNYKCHSQRKGAHGNRYHVWASALSALWAAIIPGISRAGGVSEGMISLGACPSLGAHGFVI